MVSAALERAVDMDQALASLFWPPFQYSSANVTAIRRSVTDGSVGWGEGLGATQEVVESCSDRSIKKRVCAFIVPIGSRGSFKAFERAAVEPRYACRIEEYDLPAAVGIRQRAEQRQVILAAEEHDVVFRVVPQHAEIVILIRLATAFVGVGTWAEGDVIRRR